MILNPTPPLLYILKGDERLCVSFYNHTLVHSTSRPLTISIANSLQHINNTQLPMSQRSCQPCTKKLTIRIQGYQSTPIFLKECIVTIIVVHVLNMHDILLIDIFHHKPQQLSNLVGRYPSFSLLMFPFLGGSWLLYCSFDLINISRDEDCFIYCSQHLWSCKTRAHFDHKAFPFDIFYI